ncbi:hypothetical protein ACI3KS_05100 [Microbacterium sp. ZW T5_45]|uniref:hypothetical protein n=1 Tax=Microbacterium sp. ZW T5_45 TaxID=3378080 RepID=UPI0038545173
MSTLTPFTDMDPVPRVLIDVPVSEFPAGSVTVSLTRTADGRTMDVRGGQRMPSGSPVVVLDPEPAFGVPNVYTLIGRDAGGVVVGSWPLGSVVVAFDGVVIQQPLDTRLAVRVTRLAGTARELIRETPGELVYPQGQSLPGLVGLGPRRGLRDVALALKVASGADADMLQATLGTYDTRQLPIWLVRTPPGQRLPRILFCRVGSLRELDDSWWTGAVRFTAVVTEVTPPAPGIAGVALTYSDVKVFYSTYSAVKARYATYSDVKRDTSLIGAADA